MSEDNPIKHCPRCEGLYWSECCPACLYPMPTRKMLEEDIELLEHVMNRLALDADARADVQRLARDTIGQLIRRRTERS